MFSFIARHKIASLMVFLNVIAILVVVLIIVLHNAKTATISIYVAPSEAEIELNGGKYDNFQEYDVMPGKYHVKISMEEMQTKEFDFEIFDGEFKRVKTYLLDSEGGFSYYLGNPDEMLVLENAVAEENRGDNIASENSGEQDVAVREFIEGYKKITSIQDVLPLEYSNTYDFEAVEPESVVISWGEDGQCEEKEFCLLVHDLTGNNHEKALEMIRDSGFEPSDYEIVFIHWGDDRW